MLHSNHNRQLALRGPCSLPALHCFDPNPNFNTGMSPIRALNPRKESYARKIAADLQTYTLRQEKPSCNAFGAYASYSEKKSGETPDSGLLGSANATHLKQKAQQLLLCTTTVFEKDKSATRALENQHTSNHSRLGQQPADISRGQQRNRNASTRAPRYYWTYICTTCSTAGSSNPPLTRPATVHKTCLPTVQQRLQRTRNLDEYRLLKLTTQKRLAATDEGIL